MPDITVTVTNAQYKAISHFIPNPQKWVEDALRNKIIRCMERAVVEFTNLNPEKLTNAEKIDIINAHL